MSNTTITTNHKQGIAIGFTGGLVISVDIPLILLAGSDPFLMMFARGLGMAVICWLIFHFGHHNGRRWTQTPDKPLYNRRWLEVSILYSFNNILITWSAFSTTPANLVFILAFNPMIAALLSWWLIGERPKLITWLAILATTGGVALIVGDGLGSDSPGGGTHWGDLTALACASVLALALVRTRQSGMDMSLAPGFGGLLAATFTLPLVLSWSSPPQSVPWLFANSFLLMPVAGICLALAPRFIPAAQAAMFYLVETVLAPIWVWMIFGEAPTEKTLLGGAIVLSALAIHSLVKMRQTPRKTVIAVE